MTRTANSIWFTYTHSRSGATFARWSHCIDVTYSQLYNKIDSRIIPNQPSLQSYHCDQTRTYLLRKRKSSVELENHPQWRENKLPTVSNFTENATILHKRHLKYTLLTMITVAPTLIPNTQTARHQEVKSSTLRKWRHFSNRYKHGIKTATRRRKELDVTNANKVLCVTTSYGFTAHGKRLQQSGGKQR